MSEAFQFETMGIHPTDLPSSPINCIPASIFSKRKCDAGQDLFFNKKSKLDLSAITHQIQESQQIPDIKIHLKFPQVDVSQFDNVPHKNCSAKAESSTAFDHAANVVLHVRDVLKQTEAESLEVKNDPHDSGLSDDNSDEDSEEECVPLPPLYDAVLRSRKDSAPMQSGSSTHNEKKWSSPVQCSTYFTSETHCPNFPSTHNPFHPGGSQNPYQFLDQPETQRIECAENGKSYMQLGISSHPRHLPVTPIIQPKQNLFKRQILRNGLVTTHKLSCDRGNCLKSQRTKVLNLSMHKLHIARQSNDGRLRRSVLICNMLKIIEDVSEKESVSDQEIPQEGLDVRRTDDEQWSPTDSNSSRIQDFKTHASQMLTPSQYNASILEANEDCSSSVPPYPYLHHSYVDTFESTLKDFNSIFRLTPASQTPYQYDSVTSFESGQAEDDKSINWGSVLRLSNQSDMDPLNNNTYSSESWPIPHLPMCTSGPSSGSPSIHTGTFVTSPNDSKQKEPGVGPLKPSGQLNRLPMVSHRTHPPAMPCEGIGWKLSADDVLRVLNTDSLSQTA